MKPLVQIVRDRILSLEDGISVLSEESVSEGLSIQQLDDYLGTFYIDDLDENARKQSNIAFDSSC